MSSVPAKPQRRLAPVASTTRRRSAAERRQEIVTTAIALADQVGLDRITARDIATSMGVAPGLVHHYFATIDELVVAALKFDAGARRGQIEKHVLAHPPLPALCGYVVEMSEISRTSARIWLSAWMTEARRTDLAHELARQDDLDIELLENLLRRGLEAGVFRLPDARAAALRILTVLDGVVVRVSRRLDHQYREEVDALVWGVVEREVGFAPGTLRPVPRPLVGPK